MKSSVFELGYGRYEILDLLKDLRPYITYDLVSKEVFKKNFYLRRLASKKPEIAYFYAFYLEEERPHPVTREGVCKSPWESYCYARDVDKGPHPLTKESAGKERWISFLYTRNVEKL